MELAALKKELHALIEETADKQVLLDLIQKLEASNNLQHETTDEFWAEIHKAQKSIAEGKGISDQDARQIINRKIFAEKWT